MAPIAKRSALTAPLVVGASCGRNADVLILVRHGTTRSTSSVGCSARRAAQPRRPAPGRDVGPTGPLDVVIRARGGRVRPPLRERRHRRSRSTSAGSSSTTVSSKAVRSGTPTTSCGTMATDAAFAHRGESLLDVMRRISTALPEVSSAPPHRRSRVRNVHRSALRSPRCSARRLRSHANALVTAAICRIDALATPRAADLQRAAAHPHRRHPPSTAAADRRAGDPVTRHTKRRSTHTRPHHGPMGGESACKRGQRSQFATRIDATECRSTRTFTVQSLTVILPFTTTCGVGGVGRRYQAE